MPPGVLKAGHVDHFRVMVAVVAGSLGRDRERQWGGQVAWPIKILDGGAVGARWPWTPRSSELRIDGPRER